MDLNTKLSNASVYRICIRWVQSSLSTVKVTLFSEKMSFFPPFLRFSTIEFILLMTHKLPSLRLASETLIRNNFLTFCETRLLLPDTEKYTTHLAALTTFLLHRVWQILQQIHQRQERRACWYLHGACWLCGGQLHLELQSHQWVKAAWPSWCRAAWKGGLGQEQSAGGFRSKSKDSVNHCCLNPRLWACKCLLATKLQCFHHVTRWPVFS